ncbi:hypothetical protein GCM10009612_61130 [Streptomyces beijiangensis]
MLTAVSGAAVASTADSGHKGPGATSGERAKDGSGSKTGPVAKRYGISPDRLERALRIIKPLVGQAQGRTDGPAVVGTFARELGLTTAQARQLLAEIFASDGGPRKPGPGDKGKEKRGFEAEFRTVVGAKALAGELGVPVARAQHAVDKLAVLAAAGHGSIDPGGSAFTAIAKEIGVAPQQLSHALAHLKAAAARSADKRAAR